MDLENPIPGTSGMGHPSNCPFLVPEVPSPIAKNSNQSFDFDVDDARKFHVLDEVEHSDSEKSDGYDSDIPDEEIEKMLEEAFENNKKRKADEEPITGEFIKI